MSRGQPSRYGAAKRLRQVACSSDDSAHFTVHLVWIAAALLFVLRLVEFALGRGSGGRQRFFRW